MGFCSCWRFSLLEEVPGTSKKPDIPVLSAQEHTLLSTMRKKKNPSFFSLEVSSFCPLLNFYKNKSALFPLLLLLFPSDYSSLSLLHICFHFLSSFWHFLLKLLGITFHYSSMKQISLWLSNLICMLLPSQYLCKSPRHLQQFSGWVLHHKYVASTKSHTKEGKIICFLRIERRVLPQYSTDKFQEKQTMKVFYMVHKMSHALK